jgi:hypothetical protein
MEVMMPILASPTNNGSFLIGNPNLHKTAVFNRHPDLDSEENRQKLTKMIMRLFDHWDLTTADQLELLGLSANSRRMLSQYRKKGVLPNNRDMQDRLGWLLVVHQNLRTLYPENPEICYTWIHRQNQYLDNWMPLEVMKKQGLIGIFRVAQLLEHLVEL